VFQHYEAEAAELKRRGVGVNCPCSPCKHFMYEYFAGTEATTLDLHDRQSFVEWHTQREAAGSTPGQDVLGAVKSDLFKEVEVMVERATKAVLATVIDRIDYLEEELTDLREDMSA